ncbi:MAG: ABC transporter permease, partial [Acidobacteriota bacterium]
MRYELFVALRYLTARRKQAVIWIISLISLGGVTVGIMALIIALALMTGFQEDIQDKILGANAHLTVRGGWGGSPIDDPAEVRRILEEIPEVVATAPVILDHGMLISERNPTGYAVSAKGISPVLEP